MLNILNIEITRVCKEDFSIEIKVLELLIKPHYANTAYNMTAL